MPISYLIVPGFASSSKTFLPQPSRDLIQHESGTWSKVTRKGLLPLPDPEKRSEMIFKRYLILSSLFRIFFPTLFNSQLIQKFGEKTYYKLLSPELIYRSLTRRWSFIIFPKSFQNLSQNCKFLFCAVV